MPVTEHDLHRPRRARKCACKCGVIMVLMQVLAPMAIGFTVFICHLVAIPIDGCSINRKYEGCPVLDRNRLLPLSTVVWNDK